jgi:hypothetical protein
MLLLTGECFVGSLGGFSAVMLPSTASTQHAPARQHVRQATHSTQHSTAKRAQSAQSTKH